MFCPNCGAEGQNANAYCKRCGEWLPDLKASRVKWGGETPEQHLKIMLFLMGFSAIVALCSAILLYATQLPGGMRWPVALTAAFCISIAAWQVSSFLIGLKLHRRLKRGRDENVLPPVLDEGKSKPALNAPDTSRFVGATSVAENTTELLTPLSHQTRGEKR